ncbi:hypothetical protein [Seonamhaeicola aphaedonensis]|uniref:DUF3887 domain-containing protein n=1 Tax=Seonamhaeicola aphaedonensis TaxID=1461338 RepID=A0A3D9H822_9FLAO|nr:hypothetical protein [Seonamhaeicola aphaedonensis]RED45637.1 hypothetical protein DFQ02_10815 [Seonamhaeicola aphaedonensis]
MRPLFLFMLLFIQTAWGQISMSDCISVTQDAISDIKSDNLEQALDLFRVPSESIELQLEKAISNYLGCQHKTELKNINSKTKDHFINKCVYMDDTGEIHLMISFYYEIDTETALIDKITIKDKSHFPTKEILAKRKKGGLIINTPPPVNN